MSTINPMDRATARALLAITAEQGLPVESVQVTDEGFVVPDSVGDAYAATLGTPEPEPAPEPATSKKAPARKTEKE